MAENLLHLLQLALKAPKDLFNDFGKFRYRSCESIIESLKPLLAQYKAYVILTDTVSQVGTRNYVNCSATLYKCAEEDEVEDVQVAWASGWAREPETKKGMDESQITGSASSYARKQALSGLFLLDDNKDADYLKEGDEPKAPKRTDYVVDQRSPGDSTNGTKKGPIDEGRPEPARIPGGAPDPTEAFNRALAGETQAEDPRYYPILPNDKHPVKVFKEFMNAKIKEAGVGSDVHSSDIDYFLMSFKTGPKDLNGRYASATEKGNLNKVWTSYLDSKKGK